MSSFFNQVLGIQTLSRSQVTAKWARPESGSKFLSWPNGELHFRDEGQGPALLLIHGIADSLHTWDPWVEQLSDHYRILRIDLPGFGLSSLKTDSVGPFLFLEAIEAFLQFLNIHTGLKVAGNSLGGYLAGLLAAERPKLVEGIVALNPAGYPLKRAPWMVEAANLPVLKSVARHVTPFSLIKKTTQSLFFDSTKVTPQMLERFHDLSRMDGNRQSYIRIFSELERRKSEYPSFVSGIQCPALVIWGKQDPWLPLAHTKMWKDDLTLGEVRLYDKCGHMPQLEQPEQSARDANEFFQKIKSRQ